MSHTIQGTLFVRRVSVFSEVNHLRCRCKNGHPFSCKIFTVISTQTHKGTLEKLHETGCQSAICPVCQVRCRVAVPLVVHVPKKDAVALMIPEPLCHLELQMRSELLKLIESYAVEDIPAYFADFQTFVGTGRLLHWIRGHNLGAFHSAVSDANPPLLKSRDFPYFRDTEEGNAPPIHEAFADLARDGSQSKPKTANPKEMDRGNIEEWLDEQNPTDSPEIPSGYSHSIQDASGVNFKSLRDTRSPGQEPPRSTNPSRARSSIKKDSYSPVHSVPIAAKEALFDIEGNSVILIHRMPKNGDETFHPKQADLWFQLHVVEGYPIIAMTLVADPWRLDSAFLYWIVDITRESHREVAYKLQKEYRAEIRLYTPALTEASRFSIESEREANVSTVIERAVDLLSSKPQASFDTAIKVFEKNRDNLLGDSIPPFRYYDISTIANFDTTYSRLEQLAHWLVPRRFEYLIFRRSFPVKHVETKIAETLNSAMQLGVRIPDILKPRAIQLNLANDNADLLRKLTTSFDKFLESGKGPSREAAAKNWQNLRDDFSKSGLEFNFEEWNHAGDLLGRFGVVDQKEPGTST